MSKLTHIIYSNENVLYLRVIAINIYIKNSFYEAKLNPRKL